MSEKGDEQVALPISIESVFEENHGRKYPMKDLFLHI